MAKRKAKKVKELIERTYFVATKDVAMLGVDGCRYDSLSEALKDSTDDLGLEEGDDVFIAEVTVKSPAWYQVEKVAKSQGRVKLDVTGTEFVTESA